MACGIGLPKAIGRPSGIGFPFGKLDGSAIGALLWEKFLSGYEVDPKGVGIYISGNLYL